jgi:hypothetical protein
MINRLNDTSVPLRTNDESSAMTDKTQILDVTYGTFSCRLEGFDDSVETMKLVVGYFHALAGHDRFMDTALQAPDMDTLARLTGDRSEGDVDAAVEDGKLNLRLRGTPDAPAERLPLRLTPAAAVTQAPDQLDEPDTAYDDTDSDSFDSPEEEEIDDDAPLHAESVAAKLDRIRAVVGRGHVPETADSYAEDETEDDDDTIAPRGGVNPLAQRLAELAKRNSELAAIEAGILPAPLAASEQDEDDIWDGDDLDDLAEVAEMDDADSDAGKAVDQQEPDVLVLTDADAAPQDDDDFEDDVEDEEDLHLANFVDDDDLNLHDEVAEVERQIEERNKRQELSRTADAAISRILEQTDAQLNQPELRRQQDAFAQLKAAVAATEAARQLGDYGGPKRRPSEVYRRDLGAFEAEEMEDAFASDLDADDTADADHDETAFADDTGAPAAVTPPKPSPTLRLVASQRATDLADQTDAASLRLRQIAAKVDTTQVRTIGFDEFAAQHDVSDLGDMIEAAAAYIAYISKEDDFSRPQVMKIVQSVADEDISREDGLRSFGRLLRQNRIVKLENGRFQVAPTTRFRPDDLAARG